MTDENIIESNVESTKKSKKVLVLFAHPAQTRSEVNVPLFHEAKMNKHVTAVDLYAEYPDFNIDIFTHFLSELSNRQRFRWYCQAQ